MSQRFGEPVRPGIRYRQRPGVYAVLRRGDAVLVTHQALPKSEVQLPGGGIDPGEPPLRALHREVFEETGWSIAAPRRLGMFRRFTYLPEYDLWAEKVCSVYLAWPGRCHGPPQEAGHTALWLPITEAIAELENPGDRHFLRRVVEQARFAKTLRHRVSP